MNANEILRELDGIYRRQARAGRRKWPQLQVRGSLVKDKEMKMEMKMNTQEMVDRLANSVAYGGGYQYRGVSATVDGERAPIPVEFVKTRPTEAALAAYRAWCETHLAQAREVRVHTALGNEEYERWTRSSASDSWVRQEYEFSSEEEEAAA